MSIASTVTKLSLAEFAKIAGFHPLHFEQVEFTQDGESPSVCGAAILQYSWQSHDRVAREDIARAIAEAELMIERQLKWHLIPSWDADEWKQAPRPHQPDLIAASHLDIRGYNQAMQASWRKVISGGIEAKTLLQLAQAIVWVTDAGTAIRTGGVTAVVPSGTVACEVEIFYPGHSGESAYQIRPAQVSVVGTTATITFRRELCVKEDLLEALSPEPADYADDNDFLTTVDVYRHWNDPSTQVTIMWEPGGCGDCGGTGCVRCSYSVQTGCLYLRTTPDAAMLGWQPGAWNATTQVFDTADLNYGTPDLARLYYYSGLRSASGCPRIMSPEWARCVTYLALSMLERPMCDCTADVWETWREDLAVLSGGEQAKTFAFTLREAAGNNPFGTRRGALYAWRRVTEPDVAAVQSTTLV